MEYKNTKITSVDMEMIASYSKESQIDVDLLANYLKRAKGELRTMRQFALQCQANPATFSRILNGKTSREVSTELLLAISKNANASSGITFEMLMNANGYIKKDIAKKTSNHKRSGIIDIILNIVINELVKRKHTVSTPKTPVEYDILNYKYHPSFSIQTNAYIKDKKKEALWAFEYVDYDSNKTSFLSMASLVRQKLLFILGMFYLEKKPSRLSFVFDNQALFDYMVDVVKTVVIKDPISFILVDRNQGKIMSEYMLTINSGIVNPVFNPMDEEPIEAVENSLWDDLKPEIFTS